MLSENYQLSPDLEKKLNNQMLLEYYSAYTYLSASHFFAINNLKGFACWFGEQSKEEYEHGEKFRKLLLEHGIMPSFDTSIHGKVHTNWGDYKTLLQDVLRHEKDVSNSIHEILKLAKEQEKIVVCSLLKWFVKEQLEEENSIQELTDLHKYYTENQAGLIDMDRMLSKRCKKGDQHG